MGSGPTPARDSQRGIGRPWPPCSVGNGPRPSGLGREGWFRVRHSRPEWLGHREDPRVPRQCQDSTRLNRNCIKPSAVLALSRRWAGNGLPDQRPQVRLQEPSASRENRQPASGLKLRTNLLQGRRFREQVRDGNTQHPRQKHQFTFPGTRRSCASNFPTELVLMLQPSLPLTIAFSAGGKRRITQRLKPPVPAWKVRGRR